VLDFTQSLAGPYGTQILADMGAEVVKVETLGKGDATRTAGPYHPSDTGKQHAGYFHSINRNKKSIALNLKDPVGREIVFDLIRQYDIVVENFRADTMERLGLSYEELRARDERVIYAALRGFGDPRTRHVACCPSCSSRGSRSPSPLPARRSRCPKPPVACTIPALPSEPIRARCCSRQAARSRSSRSYARLP
jgi:hypothetical protein